MHLKAILTYALVACPRKLLIFANTVVGLGMPWTNTPLPA